MQLGWRGRMFRWIMICLWEVLLGQAFKRIKYVAPLHWQSFCSILYHGEGIFAGILYFILIFV